MLDCKPGLVVSNDFGISWSYPHHPPHHLVATVSYRYNQSHLAYGWGDPSSIVRSPIHCTDEKSTNIDGDGINNAHQKGQGTEDCYYYVAMFNRNQIGEQSAGTCIARTKHLLDPTSWRAWNGSHFSVQFADPYTQAEGNFNPSDHVCKTITLSGLPRIRGCTVLDLVWSEYLHKFVATIGCLFGHSFGKSFYFSTSIDLIHWSNVTEFYNRDEDLPPDVFSKTTGIQYPSLLDPTGGPNFYTIGKNPYLFWTSIGHSPYKDGRYLWATPIQFDINADTMEPKEIS